MSSKPNKPETTHLDYISPWKHQESFRQMQYLMSRNKILRQISHFSTSPQSKHHQSIQKYDSQTNQKLHIKTLSQYRRDTRKQYQKISHPNQLLRRRLRSEGTIQPNFCLDKTIFVKKYSNYNQPKIVMIGLQESKHQIISPLKQIQRITSQKNTKNIKRFKKKQCNQPHQTVKRETYQNLFLRNRKNLMNRLNQTNYNLTCQSFQHSNILIKFVNHQNL